MEIRKSESVNRYMGKPAAPERPAATSVRVARQRGEQVKRLRGKKVKRVLSLLTS